MGPSSIGVRFPDFTAAQYSRALVECSVGYAFGDDDNSSALALQSGIGVAGSGLHGDTARWSSSAVGMMHNSNGFGPAAGRGNTATNSSSSFSPIGGLRSGGSLSPSLHCDTTMAGLGQYRNSWDRDTDGYDGASERGRGEMDGDGDGDGADDNDNEYDFERGTDGDCDEENEDTFRSIQAKHLHPHRGQHHPHHMNSRRSGSPSGQFCAQEWSGVSSRTAELTAHIGNISGLVDSDTFLRGTPTVSAPVLKLISPDHVQVQGPSVGGGLSGHSLSSSMLGGSAGNGSGGNGNASGRLKNRNLRRRNRWSSTSSAASVASFASASSAASAFSGGSPTSPAHSPLHK